MVLWAPHAGEINMIELRGQYNTATIFTDNAEYSAMEQVKYLLNQPFMAGSQILTGIILPRTVLDVR